MELQLAWRYETGVLLGGFRGRVAVAGILHRALHSGSSGGAEGCAGGGRGGRGDGQSEVFQGDAAASGAFLYNLYLYVPDKRP